MPISWNEIRKRALELSRSWADEVRESASYATFWDAFFEVFGVSRRAVASFQEPVKGLSGHYGFIDLFWKGVVLVEHKSRGADLNKAEAQAFNYIQDLCNEGRMRELPRYVIITDYDRIKLFDLDGAQCALPLLAKGTVGEFEFRLKDLHKHVHRFAFIAGYEQFKVREEAPINLQAVELLGDLHAALEAGGYKGHDLEVFLVRILFCLFAEDTGIFERESFHLYINNRTQEDGSDLGLHLARLFEVLNTPPEKRQFNLDEELAQFPYVNGGLFAQTLRFADFNKDMRDKLLQCTLFSWGAISPAIFGSLFQGIMDPVARRKIGAHYTSESDILKLIRPLFLDELRAEFDAAAKDLSSHRRTRLEKLLARLSTLRFLDPACGCGNFLIISYRELRRLEIDILKVLYKAKQLTAIGLFSRVDVDQFYGMEIEEWPARIAEVALWLMDHLMNQEITEAFGERYVRIPLKKSPNIHIVNALTADWREILTPSDVVIVLGNPPFSGAKYQTQSQRDEIAALCEGRIRRHGILDYVCGWYLKASAYIEGTKIRAAFVSTNSITQGEQVEPLWSYLFQKGVQIHFAYRTFRWESEARGAAHVHVVIIGFGCFESAEKVIFENIDGDITALKAKHINAYLIDSPNILIASRQRPLQHGTPEMGIGNKPIDDGNYLFTRPERDDFLRREPLAAPYFRRWYGSEEFLNNGERWCLWLGECPPDILRQMPECLKRVEAVRAFRLASKSMPTQEIANKPTRFHVENMPRGSYLVLPEVSSERRQYIPLGFFSPEIICSNLVKIVHNATLYHFSILTSLMHNAWMRQVAGRLESRYRYSAGIVYNNFPWPEPVSEKDQEKIASLGQSILDVRAKYVTSSLADLYDPRTMPQDLLAAHRALDRAVERCYRKEPFQTERERVEFLFSLYQKITEPLTAPAKAVRRGARRG